MLSMQWSSGKNNFITEKVRSSSVGMIRFLVYSLEVLNINFFFLLWFVAHFLCCWVARGQGNTQF